MSEWDEIEDRTYFTQRATQELIRAVTCENNAAAKAHLDMAAEYTRRADKLAKQFEA